MAQISTTISTDTLTAGGQRIIDMSANAMFYDNEATKILAILHKANLTKEVVGNREYFWREDDLLNRASQVGAAGDGVTSIGRKTGDTTTDFTTIFRVNDIVINCNTKELMLITAVAATSLTVIREYGQQVTGTVVVTDADVLLILGEAKTEGSAVRTVMVTTETKRTNYTQEFTMPVKTNWELEGQRLYGMDERRKQQAKLAIDHQKDIALSLWFNHDIAAGSQTSGGGASSANPRYVTKGFYYMIQDSANLTFPTSGSNRLLNMGGTMDIAEWENWLRAVKRYNQSGEIWVFASSLVWSVVNSFIHKGSFGRIVPNDGASNTYGFEITDYVSPGLRAHLIEEKIFEEYAGSTQGFSDIAVAMDLAKTLYRFQQGWDTKLIENIVQDGTHAYVDEYITICGGQLFLPKAHGIARNITG